MEFIISFLTSSVIVGLAIFVLKESFKSKLSILSKDIDQIKTYQIKDFDNSSKAIKDVWCALAQIDSYIKQGLPKDIDKGKISNEALTPYHLAIQENLVFLPDEIYQATKTALNNMSQSWVTNHQNLISIVNEAKSKGEPPGQCLPKVNDSLQQLRKEFDISQDTLRLKYREFINKHTAPL